DTPGHDGAVLIEGERVTSFGVHLPLSSHPEIVNGAAGTRHTAALGFSEVCDALVIVVSEETGTVRIARNGRLHPVRDLRELKTILGEFWTRYYRNPSLAKDRTRTAQMLGSGALALGLSVLAWFLFVFQPGPVQRSYTAPVVFEHVPAGWVAQTVSDTPVRLVLSGPDHFFSTVDPSRLVLTYNLTQPVAGTYELPTTSGTLHIPKGLKLIRVDPAVVLMNVDRAAP
ncbi:MAG: diadenylate cyclase, partial [Gemmatimonadota bacterium]|nr:diadenylate cyclase [Gemmatimonadota bacterium]